MSAQITLSQKWLSHQPGVQKPAQDASGAVGAQTRRRRGGPLQEGRTHRGFPAAQ